jgi:hypothetical protein
LGHSRTQIADETIVASAIFSSSGRLKSIQLHRNFPTQMSKAKEPGAPASSMNTCSQKAAQDHQTEKKTYLIVGFGPPLSVFSSFLLVS